MDLTSELVDQLRWHWDFHVRPRLARITDDAYLWEPVDGCWSVRPRAEARTALAAGAGDWVVDFEHPEPQAPPVTTIAWRLAHLRMVFGQRNHRHFGAPAMEYGTTVWASDAATAVGDVDREYTTWVDHVAALDAVDLDTPVGDREPLYPASPMAALVLHINREAIHHAAEVLVLADLFAHQPRNT